MGKSMAELQYSTVQKKCKRNLPKSAKLREFRTFVSDENAAKFRKQRDESKRNFAA